MNKLATLIAFAAFAMLSPVSLADDEAPCPRGEFYQYCAAVDPGSHTMYCFMRFKAWSGFPARWQARDPKSDAVVAGGSFKNSATFTVDGDWVVLEAEVKYGDSICRFRKLAIYDPDLGMVVWAPYDAPTLQMFNLWQEARIHWEIYRMTNHLGLPFEDVLSAIPDNPEEEEQ